MEFKKTDLISMARQILAENRGWWDDSDPDDQQRIKNIEEDQDVLAIGKLADPTGAINDASGDYADYLNNTDPDEFDGGEAGKKRKIACFNVLMDEV